MRLSSLVLGFLLLGSYSAFSAGADMEAYADKTRFVPTQKPYEINFTEGHILTIDLKMSFTKSQIDNFLQVHLARAIEEGFFTTVSDETETQESQYTKQARQLLNQETFKVEGKDASPEFFDALCDVVESEPELCDRIKHIQISLSPEQDYTKSRYELPTVLNYLIDQTQLESLSLSNFHPKTLNSCLASISSKKSLKKVSFCNNSLDEEGFRWVVESLPYVVLESADFSRNKIYDVERLAFILPKIDKIRSLIILNQLYSQPGLNGPNQVKTLDLEKEAIIEKSSKYGSSLREIY